MFHFVAILCDIDFFVPTTGHLEGLGIVILIFNSGRTERLSILLLLARVDTLVRLL